MPSTSAGVSPASSSAALIAWQASESSVPSRPFLYSVCPMPTIAVWSLMVTAALPTLELRRTAFDERHHSFRGVLGAADQLLGEALVPEGGDAIRGGAAAPEPLGQGDGLGRRGSQTACQFGQRLLEVGARHDLVRDSDAVGLSGGGVVTEEEQLLGLLRPDESGEDVGPT